MKPHVIRATPEGLRADDLRDLGTDQLLVLFRGGSAPETLESLEGDPRGLGLALQLFRGSWLDRWLQKRSRHERFIWHGKSFRMKTPIEGWGFNRIAKGPLVALFPFKTCLGPSVVDGQPCVILDYDVPRNPWWERLTYDELREVSPGVYLGISMIRWFGRRPIVIWFAVDANTPSDFVCA